MSPKWLRVPEGVEKRFELHSLYRVGRVVKTAAVQRGRKLFIIHTSAPGSPAVQATRVPSGFSDSQFT